MPRLEFSTKEIVNLIRPNAPSQLKHLRASGNKIKFNIRIIRRILEPQFKLNFKRHHGNRIILGLSFDMVRGVDQALNTVLGAVLNMSGGVRIIDQVKIKSGEVHITIDHIQIQSIRQQSDRFIVDFSL